MTENGMSQAGSRRYCGSHSSVASSYSSDAWFVNLFLQYSKHTL